MIDIGAGMVIVWSSWTVDGLMFFTQTHLVCGIVPQKRGRAGVAPIICNLCNWMM